MTVKTRETLMQRAMNGKPIMGQELRDLIDTMFWLKASPEQKAIQVVRQEAERSSGQTPALPDVPGNGFVKIGSDGKWFTDPSVYITKPMGDSYYFRNALFPMDPALYLAGDRTFKNFVDSARAAFTGGDGIDITLGDIAVDNTVSRVGHQHALTLSGDVSGSGLVGGTISTTVNAIRGGVVPPPGTAGYFYWTGSSYSWVDTPTIALDDLADVALASVAAGQVLWYDGSVGQWINKTMVANDLPTHASRHHSGGSDPLVGQSIAGLLTTSSPVFADLSLDGNLWLRNSGVRNWSIFGSNAFELASRNSDGSAIDLPITIQHDAGGVIRLGGTTSRPVNLAYTLQMGGVTTINNAREGILTKLSIIKSLGATIGSASRVELLNNDSTWGQSFWSDSGGNLRLAFLQGDSTWTDRFTFMRTGALQIGGVETITSTRGGRFADLVVTGQTTLATSLTGMLKATSGVISVASASDLPSHASRHHSGGADPLAGQSIAGLLPSSSPEFAGLKIGALDGILKASFGVVGVATGADLPSHASRHYWNGGDPMDGQSLSGLLTSSSPTFAGLTIGSLNGMLKATAGVVSVAGAASIDASLVNVPYGRIPFGGSSGLTWSDKLRWNDPYTDMLWVDASATFRGTVYADDLQLPIDGSIVSFSATMIQFGDGVTVPRVLFPNTATNKAFQVDGLATFAHISAYLLEGDVQADRDTIGGNETRTLPAATKVGQEVRYCAGVGPSTYTVNVATPDSEAIVYRSRTTGLRVSATSLDVVDSATIFICHEVGRWTAIGY